MALLARRELFVDGYDAAGNRIYDKVNGQTCHQASWKLLARNGKQWQGPVDAVAPTGLTLGAGRLMPAVPPKDVGEAYLLLQLQVADGHCESGTDASAIQLSAISVGKACALGANEAISLSALCTHTDLR